MSEDRPILLARPGPLADALARSLGTGLRAIPALRSSAEADAALEAWRAELARGPQTGAVVVAAGAEPPAGPSGLDALEPGDWQARAELPFLAWSVALGAAAACCADGGAIVAVVETPAPLDAAGFAPEAGLADAVSALVRSVAQAEGGRGVRANAVSTPARVGPDGRSGGRGEPIAPAPSLARFPGALVPEVVGAVRLLLSPDAAGVTGTMLRADCGRSW